jgi:hypothetical protein
MPGQIHRIAIALIELQQNRNELHSGTSLVMNPVALATGFVSKVWRMTPAESELNTTGQVIIRAYVFLKTGGRKNDCD